MKRILIIAVLFCSCAIYMAASGSYKRVDKVYKFSVTNDTTADSTFAGDTVKIDNIPGWSTMRGRVWLVGPTNAPAGMGVSDSGIIKILTKNFDLASGLRLLVADTTGALPCSVSVNIIAAIGDTAIGDELWVAYEIIDTLSDSVRTGNYEIRPYITLK